MGKFFWEALQGWPRSYISGTDICHLLNASFDARYSMVKRAIRDGVLIPIRRDLYLIKKGPKQVSVDAFEIAPIIYGPSYISFESALSYHGWIPEAVRSVTSATMKRAREFETPIGLFSYERIPITAFSLGVKQHSKVDVTLWIASPWKAVADFIYTRKRSWLTASDFSEDLRVEMDNLASSDQQILFDLVQNYPSVRVKKALNILLKEVFP